MNKGIIFALGTLIGGTIGSLATWYGVKTKYEELANREIEEVRESYRKRCDECENLRKSTSQNASVTHQEARRAILGNGDDKNIDEEEKLLKMANMRSENRFDYSKIRPSDDAEINTYKEPEGEIKLEPYIITPTEFDNGEFEKIELKYYTDGTLTDDLDEVVDPHEMFGDLDIDEGFEMDSDEPDLLFIRDPKLKLDYEIVRILYDFGDGSY